MNTLDIIIIVLLSLFAIVGLVKGFIKQIISIGGWVVASICSFLFTDKLTNYFKTSNLFNISNKITMKVSSWLDSKEIFQTVIPESDSSNVLKDALSTLKLPDFLTNLLLGKAEIEMEPGMTLGDFITPFIVDTILSIISLIVIFIVCLIVFAIIGSILKKILDTPVTKPLDRLLGLAFSVCKIGIVIWGIMLLISVGIALIPSLEGFITKYFMIDDGSFHIAGWMWENNPLKLILKNVL